ncbi:hypothetical protein SPACI_008790 [Sporomusa acidovorans DSM 3132]|uniref:DUF350 domain-containing protein n=1 Tax=Sporomusa acidovorans (strain ATCC 49682 / DSM 3132 / Mol) TaxID=1123286 RepID=A0ABZ3IXR0_SPOA4|nr:hypothetical protein SPACI_15350 [Sporomusa acidovorans DSM 3132]SDE81991.1 hypothetical protein SAMN04488499_102258 [Sporomusa acidovorans]
MSLGLIAFKFISMGLVGFVFIYYLWDYMMHTYAKPDDPIIYNRSLRLKVSITLGILSGILIVIFA